jgi:hypothetical protein
VVACLEASPRDLDCGGGCDPLAVTISMWQKLWRSRHERTWRARSGSEDRDHIVIVQSVTVMVLQILTVWSWEKGGLREVEDNDGSPVRACHGWTTAFRLQRQVIVATSV